MSARVSEAGQAGHSSGGKATLGFQTAGQGRISWVLSGRAVEQRSTRLSFSIKCFLNFSNNTTAVFAISCAFEASDCPVNEQ